MKSAANSINISETTNTNTDMWNRVLARLKFALGESNFNSWIKPLRLESVEPGQITLSLPTRFMREWVMSNYISTIKECWAEEDHSIINVSLKLRDIGSATSSPTLITDEHRLAASSYNEKNENAVADSKPQPLSELSAALDARFTFDNFVVGPTNELAYEAAKSVAESDNVIPGGNPLFLYGGVGLGKTHLMHAIAWQIREKNPERKVIYLSAEKFMYQFVRALRNKDIVSFKESFRSVDVLMVDDIQFICGKNNTQEEFFHTFNALIDNNRQLIISGDRSPSDLEGMEERVRSRLGWGLVADINTTTYELRLGILESKVENMQVQVPKEVLEFLARKITSNVRELEGALNKVVAHSRLIKREITLEGTQHILRDLLRANDRIITIEDIKQKVAEHCNIKVSDMQSARRMRNIARPRQIAMYLSKKLTSHSLPEIGRKFGGKDHTTVIHAVRKVEELCEKSKEFRDDVDILSRTLES